MIVIDVPGYGRFEERGNYVRAKRVGSHVFVAGTTAIEPSGRLHAPGDVRAQTAFIFERIAEALASAGAGLGDVVRTRAYLTDLAFAGGYIDIHGEFFAGIFPVATATQSALTTPGMVVEIELDAIVRDEN